jgi:hypothetical protein
VCVCEREICRDLRRKFLLCVVCKNSSSRMSGSWDNGRYVYPDGSYYEEGLAFNADGTPWVDPTGGVPSLQRQNSVQNRELKFNVTFKNAGTTTEWKEEIRAQQLVQDISASVANRLRTQPAFVKMICCGVALMPDSTLGQYISTNNAVIFVTVSSTAGAVVAPSVATEEKKYARVINSAIVESAFTNIENREAADYANTQFQDNIVAQQRVKDMIYMIMRNIEVRRARKAKRMRDDPREAMKETAEDYNHMIFSGPPDTGKYLTSRVVTKILFKMKVVTKQRYTRVCNTSFEKLAKIYAEGNVDGGVIFVEESEDLLTDAKAKNVIDAFEKMLREKKVTFIFSGPKATMTAFLERFPSLAFFIPYHLTFDSYSVKDLEGIFVKELMRQGEKCEVNFMQPFSAVLQQLPDGKRTSLNAKIVTDVITKAKQERDADLGEIEDADVRETEMKTLKVKDLHRALYARGLTPPALLR